MSKLFRGSKRFLSGGIRIGVVQNAPVLNPDDAGCISLGQVGIVRYHDDQPVFGDFPDQFHDLDAGLGIQSAGGLIGQEDFGIIYQCTGNGDPLHLPAGELIGLFTQLVAQSDTLQGLPGPPPAFSSGDAGDGERQLDVCQHGLMGD